MKYEFSRIVNMNGGPAVVFQNPSIGKELSVNVDDFKVGRYDEWRDQSVLPTIEVQKGVVGLLHHGL